MSQFTFLQDEWAAVFFVSTYPTMMGLIDETADGQRRFGVGVSFYESLLRNNVQSRRN